MAIFGNDQLQRQGIWGGLPPQAQPFPQGASQVYSGLPQMANVPMQPPMQQMGAGSRPPIQMKRPGNPIFNGLPPMVR